MKFSENVNEFFGALAKAQGELTNPARDQEAEILTKTGKKYKFNYVGLPSTIEHIRKTLSKFGIAHSEGLLSHPNGYLITCTLGHLSGQWATSEILIPFSACTVYYGESKVPVFDEKKLAAMITYFRRYLLTSMVGICGDDDLDGIPETEQNTYRPRQPVVGSTTAKPAYQAKPTYQPRAQATTKQAPPAPITTPVKKAAPAFDETDSFENF